MTDHFHFQLYTYRLIDGRFATYAGLTEAAVFRRAQEYHGYAVVGIELLHHVCECQEKAPRPMREHEKLHAIVDKSQAIWER